MSDVQKLGKGELPKEEREKVIAEQQLWIDTLGRDKTWLDEQRANWQRLSEEREKIFQEQRLWIGELEKAKRWLEEQISAMKGQKK